MDQGLLVSEETDAGAELVRRLEKSFPIEAAFWVRGGDETRWYLYIASDNFDDATLDVAYGEVLRLAEQIASPYFDPFHVNLIKTSDPFAKATLEIHQRYPGITATRLGCHNFGGVGVEGVYLYPASLTTPTP